MYVGFRVSCDDNSFNLTPQTPLPTVTVVTFLQSKHQSIIKDQTALMMTEHGGVPTYDKLCKYRSSTTLLRWTVHESYI